LIEDSPRSNSLFSSSSHWNTTSSSSESMLSLFRGHETISTSMMTKMDSSHVPQPPKFIICNNLI
jgi:hypothetical protein